MRFDPVNVTPRNFAVHCHHEFTIGQMGFGVLHRITNSARASAFTSEGPVRGINGWPNGAIAVDSSDLGMILFPRPDGTLFIWSRPSCPLSLIILLGAICSQIFFLQVACY